MMRRRSVLVLLAFALYGFSMLASLGQASAVTRGIASFASDLTPTGGAGQYPYGQYGKVTICHHADNANLVTITVSENALPAHLAHGDTIGPCR